MSNQTPERQQKNVSYGVRDAARQQGIGNGVDRVQICLVNLFRSFVCSFSETKTLGRPGCLP